MGIESGLKNQGVLTMIWDKREGSYYSSVHNSYYLVFIYEICRRFISEIYISPFEVLIKSVITLQEPRIIDRFDTA